MFKGKLSVWVVVISVCLLISFLQNNMSTVVKSIQIEDAPVYVESEKDRDLPSYIYGRRISRLDFTESKNGDFIFSDSVDEIDGYTKVPNILYSPIVGFALNTVVSHPEGFITSHIDSDVRCIDLKAVLEAIESDLTWDALEISKKVVKGSVKLVIPNERDAYYEDVVEVLYLTLNDGKPVSSVDRAVLRDRVNGILEKSDKVSSVLDVLISEYKSPSTDHKFIIGPEFLGQRAGEACNYMYSNSFVPIYFLDTVVLKVDGFIKMVPNTENETDANEDLGAKVYENLLKHNFDLMKQSGWRVQNGKYDLSDVSKTYQKYFSVK